VVPNTPVKLIKDDSVFLMFDGQRGYGRRVAGEAMADLAFQWLRQYRRTETGERLAGHVGIAQRSKTATGIAQAPVLPLEPIAQRLAQQLHDGADFLDALPRFVNSDVAGLVSSEPRDGRARARPAHR